jgi:thiaminase/transcriptional activator TenA
MAGMKTAPLTNLILASAQPIWNEVIHHRFFREVESDTLADTLWVRYLTIEYAFIDTAAIVLGHAVTKAPSFEERRKLAFGLYGLVTDQENFFHRAFQSFEVPREAQQLRTPLSNELHNLFLRLAVEGTYADILTAFLGAEWLYLQWCGAASRTPSRRPIVRSWVDLHAGGEFAGHVYWIRDQLDLIGVQSGDSLATRLVEILEATFRAEQAFHTAVYQ